MRHGPTNPRHELYARMQPYDVRFQYPKLLGHPPAVRPVVPARVALLERQLPTGKQQTSPPRLCPPMVGSVALLLFQRQSGIGDAKDVDLVPTEPGGDLFNEGLYRPTSNWRYREHLWRNHGDFHGCTTTRCLRETTDKHDKAITARYGLSATQTPSSPLGRGSAIRTPTNGS